MSNESLSIDLHEFWLPCRNLDGYEVSSRGRVRSLDRVVVGGVHPFRKIKGVIRKLSKTYNGYMTVRTTNKGFFVHRLVLEAFTNSGGEGMQVCHNNGIRYDNRVENLRWDSAIGNNNDKVLHGTIGRGEMHSQAKLTNEQVTEIRKRGGTSQQLANKYGVSPSHIRSIWCGSFRKHG